MDEILWNSLFHLGTMKYWNLKYKSKESPIHSVDSFVSEMEKRLLALLYSGTSAKTLDLLKTEQIEALLLGAINSHLPKHASKYYTLLIARRPVSLFCLLFIILLFTQKTLKELYFGR